MWRPSARHWLCTVVSCVHILILVAMNIFQVWLQCEVVSGDAVMQRRFKWIPFENPFLRTGVKLLLIPLTMGVGYELIRLCGKHDNRLTRIIAAPGLWVQRLTVKEPDDTMIRAAIAAMELVIPENGEDLVG